LYGISEEKSTNGTITALNQFTQDRFNIPIWELTVPLGDKAKKFNFEEYVAGFNGYKNIINDIPVWELTVPLGKKPKKYNYEENTAGFNGYKNIINDIPIWELTLPLGEKTKNNFIKEEYAVNFDVYRNLINDVPIWYLDIPSTPSVKIDKSNRLENIFINEDLEKVKNTKRDGSAVKHNIIAPKSLFNATNVTQSLDFKLIMAQLEKEIRNELNTSPEGAYKK
jgi:hypothetical protein